RPLELELAFAVIGLDAVEADQEIGLPGRPAVFAVGNRLQADGLLAADQRDDLLVLDGAQIGGTDLATLVPAAHRLERGRAQQAADVTGAKRRRSPRNRRHRPHPSWAISTAIRSFAHCSSSASTLPSSVEAKPHCGDTANCSSGANFAASSMRRLM